MNHYQEHALNIVEGYVQSIGYKNLNEFNEIHNIHSDENNDALMAVCTYLHELRKQTEILFWD